MGTHKWPIDPLLQQHVNISNSLGSNLVTNGTFTGDASGWTVNEAAWTYNANAIDKDANGTGTVEQAITIAANKVYLISFVITGWTVGTVTVSLGGTSGTARGANGTFREYIETTNATGSLIFTPTNTARFTLDTVTVQEVGASPADQVTIWVDDQGGTAGKATLYIRGENGTVVGIGGDGFTFGANDEDVTLAYTADTLTLAGGQLSLPNGTLAVPSLLWTDVGIYRTDVGEFSFGVSGVQGVSWAISGQVAFSLLNDTAYLRMGSGSDVQLRRGGAAEFQMGANAASPIAQLFKGSDARAGTDTNTAGGNMTIAPGRSTGTGQGGVLYLATSPTGATGTGANALVNRVQLDFEGVLGVSAQDNASTPVEPTAPLKCFAHNRSVADDAVVTLPAITTNAWGTCVAGDASVRTQFVVDATGTATLINASASVVANADTDANLCIGTAGTQEPLQIKNRLGGVRVLNIVVWYD